MKPIIITFFTFLMSLSAGYAQQNSNSQSVGKATSSVSAAGKTLQDSLQKDKQNGTIYSKVNKDGIIEITKKEFNKIPADRQDALLKDKSYKIIEDK